MKPSNGFERRNGVTRIVDNSPGSNGVPSSQFLGSSGVKQNRLKKPSESVSMVQLQKQKPSKNSNGSTSSVSTSNVRKVPNNSESSPSNNGILRNSADTLERLTMINSPLHLDPVT
jgi:hypothetical protein